MLRFDRFPFYLIAVGLAFLAGMAAEILYIVHIGAAFDIVTIVTLLATVPFPILLIGAGYWLHLNDIPGDRYPRIAVWVAVGFAFFTIFFTPIAVFTQDTMLTRIQIIRWGSSSGAGIGALLGVFEANAIHRTVMAERSRIRNEELSHHNDRLQDIIDLISHDLKNPLTVASGHLAIVQDEYGGDSVERIAMAHDRMEEIIEQALVLAKSGLLTEDPEPVDLADISNRCWENVMAADAVLSVEQSALIRADPGRLQHLFENLFRNAVEHGGPAVTIRVGVLPGAGFYVEDDGRGIPEEDREAVLERGYTTETGGSGVGLAIVSHIVDAHGWELQVTDSSEGGARFEITDVDFESSPGETLGA